ncbi:unnamed protein product, partial [Rotaria sp. Silwood2]
ENLCLSPFLTSPITNKSASTELGTISTIAKIASASSSSSASLTITMNSGNLSSKMNKISPNVPQQNSQTFDFLSRSETNQESTSLP